MANNQIDPNLLAQLEKLKQKYDAMGQDLSSYLDGLLYSDYLTYWDYIHLDTLLSLQSPRTHFPDEKIFILYHQITELYFNLILHEQQQLIDKTDCEKEEFIKRVKRCSRYFGHLISSFDIMIEGMDQEQFLAFRMALLPSSGFQSGQYRKIEINSTDFRLLTHPSVRNKNADFADSKLEDIYLNLYWKKGATELATGKKTLTLRQFEEKYSDEFLRQARYVEKRNLRQIYIQNFKGDRDVELALKEFDHKANVLWPLQHLKSASTYLKKDPDVIKATGGTNWLQYLPPRKQMINYYPELWSEDELKDWGISINLTFE
jgi:tryptophan 2,3-dioxygenase